MQGFGVADRWFLFRPVKNLQKAKLPQVLPQFRLSYVRVDLEIVGCLPGIDRVKVETPAG